MYNYKISVIVPVYNSEKYLERCIDSILHQTYKNIEIILVNDGSEDRSKDICEKYSKVHNNICVINKSNGGLGSARNFGLDYCNGDYVGFVDSDDWIDEDYFYVLLKCSLRFNSDISSVGINITSKKEPNTRTSKKVRIKLLKDDKILKYYMKKILNDSNLISVNSSLFKREILNQLRFREGRLNEDIDFKYKALENSNLWSICDQKKYYYFQLGNSLSSGIVKKNDFYDLVEAYEILEDLVKNKDSKKNRKYAYIATIKSYFSILTRIAAYGCVEKLDEQYIEEKSVKKLRENYIYLLFSPIKISRKIVLTAFCLNYKISKKIIRVIMKIKR